jgi:hypothetical protein
VTESPRFFHLMNRPTPKHFRVLSVTRLLVAAFLLFGFVAGIVPLPSASASPTCRLACCAKRAAHSAGSCGDGSCHASLRRKRRSVRHDSTSNARELCGLARKFAVDNQTRPRIILASTKTEGAKAMAAFGTPCPSKCSGTLANSSSQRNSAAVSISPDPDTAAPQRTSFHSTHAKLSQVSCRDCAPRGPPPSFS